MFSWLWRRKDEENDGPIPLLTVAFHMNQGGNTEIDIKWASMNPVLGKYLGHLLFAIGKGCFAQHALSLLIDYKKSNPLSKDFIEGVIKEWAKREREHNGTENAPLVQPESFFQSDDDDEDEGEGENE